MTAQFPNVPDAAGVPSVLRSGLAIADKAALLVSDAVIVARLFQGPTWGIFNSNMQPVVTGDSVVRVDFRREWRISDYPIEKGSFASYNKVATPYDARLTFTCGGVFSINSVISAISATSASGVLSALTGDSARSSFLNTLDAAAKSLDLYFVVTPEVTYASANIIHYDYERTEKHGATMLTVDVWLEEVRVAPSPKLTQTKAEAGADPVNNGTVQTVPPVDTTDGGLSTFKFF